MCAKFGSEKPGETTSAGGAGSTGSFSDSVNDPNSGYGRSGGRGYGYQVSTPTKEEIIKKRLEQRERRQKTKDIYEQRGDKELALDYHKLIQQARNRLGWSQEELGQKINERKSVISKLENKSMKPDDKLVRKLEKALGISLMEIIE